jgi:hypothetical protein
MATQDQKLESLTTLLKEVLSEKSQDINIVDLAYLNFNSTEKDKGLIWSGSGSVKQFIFKASANRFSSSESLDLAKEKNLSINGIKVLDDKELGPTVTKSNLREVGRLKGLIVDGAMSINQYLYYNATSDRLGLGTDEPNAALSICDEGVEISIGARDYNKVGIGAYNSADLELITDNTTRLSISATGDIKLGNSNTRPIHVEVHGTMGVNVKTIDSRATLHVGGALKFNDTLHLNGTSAPVDGIYKTGDIVWNTNPRQRAYIGWVCIQSGNPGIWAPFGEIK